MGASNSTVKSWRDKRESELIKGQLISKGIFGVFKSIKKNENCVRISALASKKRLNQKALYYRGYL